MVRVQAAEAGTVGTGRHFRLVRKDTVFDLPDNAKLPDWVVAVPAGTLAEDLPLHVKLDRKTNKWVVLGKKVEAKSPQSFGEMQKAQDAATNKALKGKSVDALA